MPELIITDQNFEKEVLQATEPVLVEFGATWCGPCKLLAPILHQLADEIKGAKIATLDVDEQSGLAQQFNIMSVPSLLFFKGGKVMDQMVGVQSKQVIAAKLEELKA